MKPSPLLSRGLSFTLAPLAALSLLLFVPGSLVVPVLSYAQAADESAEVLTRGPVHEAFAATISFKSTPGILVPKAPPAAIAELPPDQRPDGANITWIPGYWAWDEDTIGFVWVSGIWRNLPPGRQWMPGYWSESGQEYQWISGYWADEAAEEVEYLDAPPASLEAGPNSEAPSGNHSWIPGTWRWRGADYAWQGGYWDEVQPDWVWMPSYYTSTPRGYLFVDGYYDYDVPRRGLLFAPVRFRGDRYSQPDYSYRPSVVISIGAVLDHLFLRPRSRHYYFGDYYAPEYRRSGYFSSYNYYSGGHGYDPLYAHERWRHRDDSGWDRRNEDNFAFYRDHQNERPPRTFAAFAGFLSKPDRNRRVQQGFASRLNDYADRKDNKLRFKSLDDGEKQRFTRNGSELRKFAETRKNDGRRDRDQEVRNEGGRGNDKDKDGNGPRRQGPSKSKALKSPVASVRNTENRDRGDTPPKRPDTGRTDDRSKAKKDTSEGPDRKGGAPDRQTDNNKPRQEPDTPGKGKPDKDTRPRGGQDRPDSKDTPKGKTKEEPRPETPKKNPKGNGKGSDNNQPEGKGNPRKDSPRQEPKAEPKAEPRRESKPEKKPETPRAAPKSEPKRDSAPKRDSKPKAEPRREAPRQEPKA